MSKWSYFHASDSSITRISSVESGRNNIFMTAAALTKKQLESSIQTDAFISPKNRLLVLSFSHIRHSGSYHLEK